MENNYSHVPVMLNEVLGYLQPKRGGRFVDGTLGGGGYTEAIMEAIGEKGMILSFDLDEMALNNFKNKHKNKNIILVHANYKDLSKIIQEKFPSNQNVKFDGVVLDLGLSSAQLEDKSRGFSFQLVDAPLDMNFDSSGENGKSTEYIINKYKEEDLSRILRDYGEERFSSQIAREILKERKTTSIKTVGQLVNIIERAVPKKFWPRNIHVATKTFQALRIATNDELNSLKVFLKDSLERLVSGGKLVVVSFHSLEDRIVKDFFKQESKNCVCPPNFPVCRCGHKAGLKILTPKPITAGENEIKNNPRARSAKLRAAEKF